MGSGGRGMPCMSGMYGTVPVGLMLLFGSPCITRGGGAAVGAEGTSVEPTAAVADDIGVEVVPDSAHESPLLGSPIVVVGRMSCNAGLGNREPHPRVALLKWIHILLWRVDLFIDH